MCTLSFVEEGCLLPDYFCYGGKNLGQRGRICPTQGAGSAVGADSNSAARLSKGLSLASPPFRKACGSRTSAICLGKAGTQWKAAMRRSRQEVVGAEEDSREGALEV